MTTARTHSSGSHWPALALFLVVYLAALSVVLSPDRLRAVAPGELDIQRTDSSPEGEL